MTENSPKVHFTLLHNSILEVGASNKTVALKYSKHNDHIRKVYDGAYVGI